MVIATDVLLYHPECKNVAEAVSINGDSDIIKYDRIAKALVIVAEAVSINGDSDQVGKLFT